MKKFVFCLLEDFSLQYYTIDENFEAIVNSLKQFQKQLKDDAQRTLDGAYCWKPQNFKESYERNLDYFLFDNSNDMKDKLPIYQKTLQGSLLALTDLESKLDGLRYNVDKRGYGIFKYGNLKRSMDASLSLQMIRGLKNDAQSLLNILSNMNSNFSQSQDLTVRPIFEWLGDYEKKQNVQQRISDSRNSTYEVIINV